MSDSKRCKSCGNPVDLDQAKAHDGACPWCLAAFTLGPEAISAPPPDAAPAKQFGKYVRTEKLGAGGMGEVWKALDTELNRWVAIKFLKDEDPSAAARFQREARTAAGLSHPGIAAIHEVGEIEGRHYLAMQFVEGRTMSHFPRKDRRLIVRLFHDAARALDHAHRHRVIHRDLKPENLMVEEREDGWHVVILDFGLARPLEGGEKLSKSGEIYGTAAYMSPEQAQGEHLDERADVYSLGASMYEVLTGQPPFKGANLLDLLRKVGTEEPIKLRKRNPRIHRDLETIVLTCLEKDRERRYPNARELAEDLERFLNSDPILARPASTLYRLRMRLGKRKAIAAAVVIAVVAVTGFAWAWFGHWKPQQEQARLYREGMSLREEMLGLSLAPKVERNRLTRRAAEARSLFEESNRYIETAEAHVMRGRCLQIEGKPDEALAAFERAHALNPADGHARIELARALLLKYRDRRSLSLSLWYREGGRVSHDVRLGPENEEARLVRERAEGLLEERSVQGPRRELVLGLHAFVRGNYSEAADRLGRYTKEDGLDVQALKLEADARFLGQDLKGFIAGSDRLLALAPDETYCVWLGRARQQTGDVKGAIAEYTRALQFDPKYMSALEARQFAYSDINDHAGALADANRMIELEPRRYTGYNARGNVKIDLGDLQGALADLQRAVELAPTSPKALIDRGAIRVILEDYAGGIADCTEGLKYDPTQHPAYQNRGWARLKLGDLRAACDDFTEGLKYDPENASLLFNRGAVRLALQETAAGEDDLAKGIEAGKRTASAYYTRGNVLREAGRPDASLADFAMALSLDPRMGEAYSGRGWAHFSLGDFDKAEADFNKAIELIPNEYSAWHLRGEIRGHRGELPGAVSDWTKALTLLKGQRGVQQDHLEQHLVDAKEYGDRWTEFCTLRERFERALEWTRSRKFEGATGEYLKMYQDFPKSEYGRISAYNLACIHSLKEETGPALDWLEKAIQVGFRDATLLKRDTDMDFIRKEERFRKILERLEAPPAKQ